MLDDLLTTVGQPLRPGPQPAAEMAGRLAGEADPDAEAENADPREARRRIRLLEQENEVLRRAAAYLSQANLPGK